MRISDWISDVCSSDLIPLSAPPDMPVHILHLHSAFDLGGKEAGAVRLMNAFGDAARHTIVSGVPDALSARDAIAPGIKYEIAQDPPPLTGRPSVKRFEALTRYMRRFDQIGRAHV